MKKLKQVDLILEKWNRMTLINFFRNKKTKLIFILSLLVKQKMSINDLPEDLFHYFPLILGSTSKRFNKKINIYTRPIVVLGDPLDKIIDYRRLKYLDISLLNAYEIVILLQKIKLYEVCINTISCVDHIDFSKLKKLNIKTIYGDDLLILSKITHKTQIIIESLYISISEIKKYGENLGKFRILNLLITDISGVTENILKSFNYEYFIIGNTPAFPQNKLLNKLSGKGLCIEYFGCLKICLDYISKHEAKSVLDVEKYIAYFDWYKYIKAKQLPKPDLNLLDDLVNKGFLKVIGGIEKIKMVHNFVDQEHDIEEFNDFHNKLHNITDNTAKQEKDPDIYNSDSED